MNRLLLAFICGLCFGLFDYLIMLPNVFTSEHQQFIATWSATIQGFSIGFLVPLVQLPVPSVVGGALVGLLISTPSAIITGMYPQIIGNGLLGGIFIGALLTLVV